MFFELGWRAADENPNGSLIKWQTGEPEESGEYIVSLKDGTVCRDEWRELYCEDEIKCWVYNDDDVVAWRKLSDIEPYKDKEKTDSVALDSVVVFKDEFLKK